MADWTVTVGDLYPPFPGVLTDSDGPVDLSAASGVQMIQKGETSTITGAAVILQQAFTADTTQNSAQLTNVSGFTNIWGPGTRPWETGSTIYGPGIAIPVLTDGKWVLPTVDSFSTGGATITMSQPATATATTVPLIANLGTVWYQWVAEDTAPGNAGAYAGGWQATWTIGTRPQFFPSPEDEWVTLQINPLP